MFSTTKPIVFYPFACKILKYFKNRSASCRFLLHKCFFLVSLVPYSYDTDDDLVSFKLTPKKIY